MSIEENTSGNMPKPAAPAEFEQKHDPPVARPNNRKTGGIYRFFRSIFTHIVFATFVVIGALGYLLHTRMIAVVGDTVLSDKYLGNYMLEHGKSSTTTASPSGTSGGKLAAATNITSQPSAETNRDSTAKMVPPTIPTKLTPPASAAKVTPPVSAAKVTPPALPAKMSPPTPPAKMPAQMTTTQPTKSSPPVVAAKSKTDLAQNSAKVQSVSSIKKNQPANNQATLVKSWQLARQYYATGKAEAEIAYLALIKNYPNNPDLPGELGNIYYNAGKLNQAATQYYNAALIQLNGSRPGIAACILGVLERIDAGKADALRGKLTRACPLRDHSQY